VNWSGFKELYKQLDIEITQQAGKLGEYRMSSYFTEVTERHNFHKDADLFDAMTIQELINHLHVKALI